VQGLGFAVSPGAINILMLVFEGDTGVNVGWCAGVVCSLAESLLAWHQLGGCGARLPRGADELQPTGTVLLLLLSAGCFIQASQVYTRSVTCTSTLSPAAGCSTLCTPFIHSFSNAATTGAQSAS
jgi:hypothetical protein